MLCPPRVICAPARGADSRPATASTTWSATVRPKRDSHIFCNGSPFETVPVASASAMLAPVAFESRSVKVSWPSSITSSSTGTETVFRRLARRKGQGPGGRAIVLARRRGAVGGGVVHRHRARCRPAQAHREADGLVGAFLPLRIGHRKRHRPAHRCRQPRPRAFDRPRRTPPAMRCTRSSPSASASRRPRRRARRSAPSSGSCAASGAGP